MHPAVSRAAEQPHDGEGEADVGGNDSDHGADNGLENVGRSATASRMVEAMALACASSIPASRSVSTALSVSNAAKVMLQGFLPHAAGAGPVG